MEGESLRPDGGGRFAVDFRTACPVQADRVVRQLLRAAGRHGEVQVLYPHVGESGEVRISLTTSCPVEHAAAEEVLRVEAQAPPRPAPPAPSLPARVNGRVVEP